MQLKMKNTRRIPKKRRRIPRITCQQFTDIVSSCPSKPRNHQTQSFHVKHPPNLHPKSWGYELWIHNSPLYTFKILAFNSNAHGSLHYHLRKTETWFVHSGQFLITTVNPKTGHHSSSPASHGAIFHLPPGSAHQCHCSIPGLIFEASSPHSNSDTYRISPSSKPKPPPLTPTSKI